MYVPQEMKRCFGELPRAFTKLVKTERRGTLADAVIIDNNTSATCLRFDGFHS